MWLPRVTPALNYPSTMFRTKRQKKEQTRPGTPRSMREESHSTQEYFLPSEGISETVIKEHITRYCGTGAEATTVLSKVCGKHVFFIEREANAS
jgi:hypothetical protein